MVVVTGTRAEYGLLAPLMGKIKKSPSLELKVVVTGAHLLSEFGLTANDIVNDGFTIDRLIPEISSAGSGGEVARQVGSGIVAFAEALEDLAPDAVVVLGDRYELLAAATAAFFLEIPIVHLHGGEVTHGAFDDAIRHTISQFARVHAVAAPEYAETLIRAGVDAHSVHVVGGLGVDFLHSVEKLTRVELEAELGVHLGDPLLLVTYHPVTAAQHDTEAEIQSLFAALAEVPEATVIFTLPNADPEHSVIVEALQKVVLAKEKWYLFSSLGSRKYLSLLSHASAVVGNSSSGLMEAPALGVPTVNIGPRQDGRLEARSVLSCGTSETEISAKIKQACSISFRQSLEGMKNPYGQAGATNMVLALLESTDFGSLV
ncbi:UDP-N-acetylglucosamine 2-epimerase [Pontimonas sp.]|nr:UDP-N-acetylglucosamine 2-epimerase [Pontimonas sp.]MDA8900962.1 UDP-N-acetylglucosamine 2-epimerase [Pontimonas sp.]